MDTLNDLKRFYEKIIKYKRLVKQSSNTFFPTDDLSENIEILRTELQRDYSFLEEAIASYGGSDSVLIEPISGRKQNVFDFAFYAFGTFTIIDRLNALNKVIQIVNRAIGKLAAEGKSWGIAKGKPEREMQKPSRLSTGSPKAFVAHGGDSPALRKLKDFLLSLDVQPLVVEEQASEGRSVGEKVDWYAKQADCAIILATKGDIDGRTGGFIPRGNVLMEIGKLQELFEDKIIYLLQSGTKFPTNIGEKVWTQFSPQSMDKAFISVARELKAFGVKK